MTNMRSYFRFQIRKSYSNIVYYMHKCEVIIFKLFSLNSFKVLDGDQCRLVLGLHRYIFFKFAIGL